MLAILILTSTLIIKVTIIYRYHFLQYWNLSVNETHGGLFAIFNFFKVFKFCTFVQICKNIKQ